MQAAHDADVVLEDRAHLGVVVQHRRVGRAAVDVGGEQDQVGEERLAVAADQVMAYVFHVLRRRIVQEHDIARRRFANAEKRH
ncbi:hypothetical protein D3C71_1921840 [compost metagenome]